METGRTIELKHDGEIPLGPSLIRIFSMEFPDPHLMI